MASASMSSVQCSLPNGRTCPNGEVDAWELKVARRGLMNLKTLLQGQPMLDLLAKQIEEGDAYFKSLIADSDGHFNESRIDISAKGISSSQFLKWFKIVNTKDSSLEDSFYLNVMAPAHPEHYSPGPYPIGIVETIGEHICRVYLDNQVAVPDFVKAYGDTSYEKKLPVTCYLDDGTLFFYGYQEIRDTEHGCDFRIRIIFPAAAPQVLFDEHTEHLAIEWRYWIASAIESLRKNSSG